MTYSISRTLHHTINAFIFLLGIGINGGAWAEPDYNADRLADAIKLAENSVKYPYGIRSIDTHGNEAYARKICLNTIRNNHKRWIAAGQPKPFIEFLGDRYCPKAADAKGHSVWARNVSNILTRQS